VALRFAKKAAPNAFTEARRSTQVDDRSSPRDELLDAAGWWSSPAP
jgi:hypothetical protein